MEHLTNIGDKKTDNNQEQLVSNASSFWKFLDDLSINDPAAYQDFMYKHKISQNALVNSPKDSQTEKNVFAHFDKNIESAQQSLNGTNSQKNEYYFTPNPFMVIKTRISSTKNVVDTLLNVNDYRNLMKKGQKLYINFLQSPYCKPLQSKSDANTKITDSTPIADILVPIQVAHILKEDIVSDECWRCDVVYHNTIYERFHMHHSQHKSQIFKKWIIEYAFRRIESQNTITVMRDYKILKTKKFIGKTPPNPQFIGDTNKNANIQKEIKLNTLETEAKVEEECVKNCVLSTENDDDDNKDKCIEEKASVLIPKYTLNVDKTKKKIIKIVIELEKENDIKDIDLELNEFKLLLKSTYYKLELVFPISINDTDIKAKFDKSKHCLKLKLPIK